MLHSKVYNEAFTQDLRDAYREGDLHYLHREIKNLCSTVAAREHGGFKDNLPYDDTLSRLIVCLCLHDCLTRHGESLGLMADWYNF